jgi:TonB family protein
MKSSATRVTLIAQLMTICLGGEAFCFAQKVSDSRPEAPSLIQKARGSIAVITGEDRSGQPIPPRVGFIIGPNFIGTINRQLPVGSRLRANLAGQESPSTNVSYSDSYRDAAIMTTYPPYLRGNALHLGDSDKVAEKDPVYLFSGTDSQSDVLESVVRRMRKINDRLYFELSAPFDRKIIGGPVFNARGEVVGILTENPEAPNLTLALPAAYLSALLKARTTSSRERSLPASGLSFPTSNHGAVIKPQLLNSPRPRYTEAARANQTQGVVRLSIAVGEDGSVKQVRVTKGLPDGLDGQAVEAAYQLSFQPAMLAGKPVNYWMSIQIEFNLR